MDYLIYFVEITEYIAFYFFSVFSLIAIFEGTKNVLNPKSPIKLLLSGITICVLLSGYNFFISYILNDLRITQPDQIAEITKLPNDWGKDLEPFNRTCKSKQLAKFYFKETGGYSKYFDLNGTLKVFSPTEADVENRVKHIKEKVKLEISIQDYHSSGWYWIFAGFIAAFFGWASTHNKHGKHFGFNS